MFSKACEYGIKSTIHIGHQTKHSEKLSLTVVCNAIDSSFAFTAKIIQSVEENNITTSCKGLTRGYEIVNEKNTKMTLLQIVNAIDGDKVYNHCSLGLGQCNASKHFHLHHKYVVC